MKKIISIFLLLILCIYSFNGCGYEYKDIELIADYTYPELVGTTLNIYNWGEYISDGSEDSIDVVREFERITGVKVNYSTFDSNESMYSLIKYGGVSYDIIFPSDYMIQRLKNENMLQKIDYTKLSNSNFISEEYKNLYFDPDNEFTVPYSVGMVGLIYNTAIVVEEPDSWSIMWDEKYKDDILTFNNPRDAFAIAQMLLGQDVNTDDKSDWRAAADKLKEQKKVLQAYVMDEVYNKMESGSAAIAPYYAGDYLSMLDNNEDLSFVYPKEGVNIFVDAACIPKNASNVEAAHLFINFLLEPEIALANAEFICYASPNTAVTENPDYYYYKDEILYPDEDAKPKTQYFMDMSSETREYYDRLWQEVKLY